MINSLLISINIFVTFLLLHISLKMTPTTRSQARKQSQTQSELIPRRKPEDIRENPGSPDRVEEFASMFPVFITAPVPLEVSIEILATFPGPKYVN